MPCMKTEEAIEKELRRLRKLAVFTDGIENKMRLLHKAQALEWVLCKNTVLEP